MKVLSRHDRHTREVIVEVADAHAMTTSEDVQFMPHRVIITYEQRDGGATALVCVLIEGPVMLEKGGAPIVLRYADPKGTTIETWSKRYQKLPQWVQRLVAENWPKSDII